MMKRILAALILTLAALPLSAGVTAGMPSGFSDASCADTTFVQRTVAFVNGIVDRFNELPPVRVFKAKDTTFYSPPPGDWTVTLKGNVFGSRIWGYTRADGRNYRMTLTSRYVLAPSVSVGYKGVSIGYSFNPWERRHADVRYDLSAYSNMAGIDATYRMISSFRGYVSADGERLGEISEQDVTQRLLSANAFYVFNYRHYSFPGSISQSYVQHRSSGSLVAGVSYSRSLTDVPPVLSSPMLRVDADLFAVGAGYGYTVVLPSRWQVMAALLPKFVVFDSRSLRISYDEDGERHNVRYDFREMFRRPEGTLNGYFAVVHWFGGERWFMAATASLDGFTIGPHAAFRLTQYRWESHLCLGVRL